jgi:hypothetical protein
MVHVVSYSIEAINRGLLSKLTSLVDVPDYAVIPLDAPDRDRRFRRFVQSLQLGAEVYPHGWFKLAEQSLLHKRFRVVRSELWDVTPNNDGRMPEAVEYDNENVPLSMLCWGFNERWQRRYLEGSTSWQERKANIRQNVTG